MPIERSIFSLNLIRYRKKKGFSQADLALAAGISNRMIGHYEVSSTLPPIEKIKAIAAALDIKPAQLFEIPDDTEHGGVLSDIDPRSIKKLKDILSLPPEDRNVLYRMLNELIRKNQLEKNARIKTAE